MGDENCGRGTLCDDLRGSGANVRSRILKARAGAFSGPGVPARPTFLFFAAPAELLRCGCGGAVGKYNVYVPRKDYFVMG